MDKKRKILRFCEAKIAEIAKNTGVAAVVVFLFLSVVSASTQPLGKWDNGPSFDIAAANGYLLVGAGEQVRIYDISTKEKIESIAFEPVRLFNGYSDVGTFRERTPPVKILHTDAGIIQGLYVSGSHLYIIGEKRFVIADISNPASAFIVSSLAIGGRDVHVQGNYAYVTGGSKITVIDVTDKSNPFPAAYINLNEDVRRLYISGNYLLTGGNSIFLYIYDISDPLHPSLLGTWADPYSDPRRSVSSVAVSGSYAYVVDYHYGMHVIDISNPANPVEVNSVIGQNEPNANDIKVFGRYLFLSTRYEGFRVYDISNPANPALVAVFSDFPGYVEGIYVYQTGYGLYVFETGYSTGWAIVDASDVENPTLLAKIPAPTCDSVVVRGNYAFYGGHNDGVWVVDVSDPSNPHEVIMIKNKGRNTGLAIDGDYLYIAGSWSELTIADISNPEDPVIMVWDFGGDIGGEMMVIDNYLYAGGVKIFDVSDKHNPRLVYSADLGFGRGAQPLARYGDYLIFGGQNGLFVVDVSDRTNPVVVGQYNLDMYTGDAEVVGNVVFAVEGSGNLYAIDISNPANPVLLDSTTGIIANKIAVYGSMAYLLPRISTWGGLRVVDVSDPENLKLVESLEGVYGNDMAESDGILYTSEGHIISTGQIEVPLTISMVNVGNITQDSAVVTWQTNKDADSLVEYGTVSGRYTESIYDSGLTKYHTLTLTGLNPGTTYYLRVTSVAGTETVTSQEVTFKTQAKSGDTSVQPADKIYPEKDARISPITRWNNGNAELIVGSHDRYRTVMEFTLPDGMGEIKSVKLYLYVESTEYSNYNHTIELYTLENAFDENSVNWTHRTASKEWDNPGGDLGILVDHYNATGDLSGTWISFTLKGGGADNPLNLSWGDTVRLILVQKVTGDWHNKYRYDRFDSREGENRPYLVVETVVDQTPPTITIISPENNSILSEPGKVLVRIKTDEEAACQYSTTEFEYGSGLDFNSNKTMHTFELSLESGEYTFYYRCVDKYGNENPTSVIHTFRVLASNTPTKPADKIYPEKDARISPITRWNNGNAELIVGSHDRYRTVMEFTLPDGMGEIKSVKLYLYVESTEYSNYNHTIELYTLENAFDENSVNWTHRTASKEWDNPGGDLGILVDHYNATGDLSGTWISFTLKGGGADNPLNLSWGDTVRLILVQKVTGDWHNKYRYDRFDSREGENRPYLVVETV